MTSSSAAITPATTGNMAFAPAASSRFVRTPTTRYAMNSATNAHANANVRSQASGAKCWAYHPPNSTAEPASASGPSADHRMPIASDRKPASTASR